MIDEPLLSAYRVMSTEKLIYKLEQTRPYHASNQETKMPSNIAQWLLEQGMESHTICSVVEMACQAPSNTLKIMSNDHSNPLKNDLVIQVIDASNREYTFYSRAVVAAPYFENQTSSCPLNDTHLTQLAELVSRAIFAANPNDWYENLCQQGGDWTWPSNPSIIAPIAAGYWNSFCQSTMSDPEPISKAMTSKKLANWLENQANESPDILREMIGILRDDDVSTWEFRTFINTHHGVGLEASYKSLIDWPLLIDSVKSMCNLQDPENRDSDWTATLWPMPTIERLARPNLAVSLVHRDANRAMVSERVESFKNAYGRGHPGEVIQRSQWDVARCGRSTRGQGDGDDGSTGLIVSISSR